ncbi:glycerophosphodiester phosphodiesterase family protein [Chitinophaga sp. ARDCPP14]|uniref:glycerophosphodiester phosphodiesterase family protein n=1 Tax=Chitinophaga sp. ARDCPP14 TaxID=3391139 RepID=UPI003F522D29
MKSMILLAAACCLAINSFGQTLPATRNKFVVVAHRGNHVSVPENTVAAIEETIRCGADYAELDLRTTKDGQLILLHNPTVDKMTNGTGNVTDLTLAEIQKLQVRSADGKVYRVPTFAEALQACKGKLNIYLDFKAADVPETWRQLQAAGMEKQVVVYLNEKKQYKAWRETAPEVPLMASLPEEIKTPEQLEAFLKKIRIAVLDNITDPAMLAVTGKYNTAVWLDVQSPDEGPASWQAAMGKGIQGVQTDHPEALITWLKQYQPTK